MKEGKALGIKMGERLGKLGCKALCGFKKPKNDLNLCVCHGDGI